MPRITINVNQDTLEAMDDFAHHVGKSRSVACASVLEMVVPMIGYLKTTYDLALKGDSDGLDNMLTSLDHLLAETRDEFESLKGEVLGAGEGANPRTCNNGGQVSQVDCPNTHQPLVFVEKNPLTPPPAAEGGENA